MKGLRGLAALATRRLAKRDGPELEARAAEVREAMRTALARLDWREARRQADLLHPMGFGRKGPMSSTEREALLAKVAKLVADAKAHPIHPRCVPMSGEPNP